MQSLSMKSEWAKEEKKNYRTHLVNKDLAGEGREGIKSGRPPPHPNLSPVSWSLHEIIPQTSG